MVGDLSEASTAGIMPRYLAALFAELSGAVRACVFPPFFWCLACRGNVAAGCAARQGSCERQLHGNLQRKGLRLVGQAQQARHGGRPRRPSSRSDHSVGVWAPQDGACACACLWSGRDRRWVDLPLAPLSAQKNLRVVPVAAAEDAMELLSRGERRVRAPVSLTLTHSTLPR